MDEYQKLQHVREDVIALLEYEKNEWLKEIKPGEINSNSEIAFHISQLQAIITKLRPQPKAEITAPRFT